MIDQLVDFCLRRRVAVIVVAALLLGFGVYAWETLSVEAYPELGDVAAQVTTQMPGLAAEEVEQLITVPLERQINGTPGLLLMRSTSTFGLSLITVLFRDGYEDYWARQRLIERISQATLPAGRGALARPGGRSRRRDLPLHAGVRRKEPAGALGDTTLDGDSRSAISAWRGAGHEFRWLYHGVPVGAGSATVAALWAGHYRRHQRDQQQQYERRRRPGLARRPKLRDPRRGPDPLTSRTSARSWSPRSTAPRCWCAISATPPSATRSARASSARTAIPTRSKASC